jgi:RNA polymerase sigma-70 factor (ECF subfamily)
MSSALLLDSTMVHTRARVTQRQAALFQQHYELLAGWCHRMVNDRDVAHDIASEAFTRLLGRWTSVADPRAYLYTTALNLIRDRWGRCERERVAICKSRVTLRTQAPPAPELRMLVEGLPKRLQQVIVLHYFADMTISSIALALNVSSGTVKSHLFDARAHLASALSESPTSVGRGPRSA